MSFATNWNIEKYQDTTELENHWRLRRSFMYTHKSKYPEDRLVSLAKLFCNIEFLGCVYNPEVMRLVHNLATQVEDIVTYRELRKNKLKRTFVQASDAVKRHSVNDIVTSNSQQSNLKRKCPINNDNVCEPTSKKNKKNSMYKLNAQDYKVNIKPIINTSDSELLEKVKNQPGWKGKLVVIKGQSNHSESSYSICSNSAVQSGLTISIKITKSIGDKNQYDLIINNEIVASLMTNSPMKHAKAQLGNLGLEEFKKYCFCVITNDRLGGKRVERNLNLIGSGPNAQSDSSDLCSGVGAKIMKMMGWAGQGLGKDESGIKDPIQAVQVKRLGFGTQHGQLCEQVRAYMENYIKSGASHSLVFACEYSKQKRASIHKLANTFNLKSKSYGTGSSRQLVVQRKLSAWQLVEELLATGGKSDKYTLQKPTHVM